MGSAEIHHSRNLSKNTAMKSTRSQPPPAQLRKRTTQQQTQRLLNAALRLWELKRRVKI